MPYAPELGFSALTFQPLSRNHRDCRQENWLCDQPYWLNICWAACCGEPDGLTTAVSLAFCAAAFRAAAACSAAFCSTAFCAAALRAASAFAASAFAAAASAAAAF